MFVEIVLLASAAFAEIALCFTGHSNLIWVAMTSVMASCLAIARFFDAPLVRLPYVVSIPLAILVSRLTGVGIAADAVVVFTTVFIAQEHGLMSAVKAIALWIVSGFVGGFTVGFTVGLVNALL